MLRSVFTLIFLFTLSKIVWADLHSAHRAFEAGNYEAAFTELLPLAEAGVAEAQVNLGWMYRNGSGVPHDDVKAVTWYLKAAKQGDAYAQYNFGKMCEEGIGIKQDYKEAVKWYRKAAEQGQTSAQFNLAEMYLDGIGVPQDLVQAYAWINLVALSGFESAEILLEELEYELDPTDLEEAHKLSKEFLLKYGNEISQ